MMERVDEFQYYRAACRRFGIPTATGEALCQYFVRGKAVGAFLEALLANDLVGAACRADDENVALSRTMHGSWPMYRQKKRGDR